jgi:DNA topoisomerase-1
VAAVSAVADRLGNTVAVCRRCYIHPEVLAAFEDRGVFERLQAVSASKRRRKGLSAEEVGLLTFLDKAH